MAPSRKERYFKTMATTSTHSIKKCGSVVAEEGVSLAVLALHDRRRVELARDNAAILMALEMGKVAVCSVNEKYIQWISLADILLHQITRDRDSIRLFRKANEGKKH